MPVHQTGRTGQAIVPCSHCNANDEGPEAGICHRHPIIQDGRPCFVCLKAANGGKRVGVFARTLMGELGALNQIPCSYCDAKGYRRI
jgi:hypothetical protein